MRNAGENSEFSGRSILYCICPKVKCEKSNKMIWLVFSPYFQWFQPFAMSICLISLLAPLKPNSPWERNQIWDVPWQQPAMAPSSIEKQQTASTHWNCTASSWELFIWQRGLCGLPVHFEKCLAKKSSAGSTKLPDVISLPRQLPYWVKVSPVFPCPSPSTEWSHTPGGP